MRHLFRLTVMFDATYSKAQCTAVSLRSKKGRLTTKWATLSVAQTVA